MEQVRVNRELGCTGSSEQWNGKPPTCCAISHGHRHTMDHIDKLSALIEMLIDEDTQIFNECKLSAKDDEETMGVEEAPESEEPQPRKPEPPSERKLPLRRRIDVAKRARDRGEAYETPGGKWMPPREQRPPCSEGCRLKCTQRLSADDRLEIFQAFWSIADHAAQWDFIARNMRVTPKEKCTTVRGESRRSFTRTYYFQPRTSREQVCKTMFLNTLGISNAWVATVCKKLTLNGFVSDDGRGKIGHRRKKVVELI